MTNNHQALIDKINKLLALATSSNQAEAELASAKALELLMRYNISQADLNARKSFIRRNEGPYGPNDPAYPFVSSLLQTYFKVRVVRYSAYDDFLKREFKRIAFMGEPHNVEVAVFMGTYLLRSFHACWEEVQRVEGLEERTKGDFFQGMTSAIEARLKATVEKVVKTNGKDLMVLDLSPELNQFARGQFSFLTGASIKGHNDPQAIAAGQAAGSSLRLSRAVNHREGFQGKMLE